MCGIAGKIYFESGKINERDLILMSDKIAHRGPDDQGIYISPDKKVGLVHRRLAIIDLSAAGHQPMTYKNRYWITFNGEIYNFWEERKKLEKYGYKFRSKSDTEVILALYDKWGVKCVDHLRGMFAFAIYDIRNQTVFLARDRMGVKPLKYYFDSKVFLFASELKAILTQSEVMIKPDREAIDHYLSFGYCPSPMTGFTSIYKLGPGHTMTVDLKTKKITKKRYWKLDFSQKLDLSEEEWTDRILKELEAATKIRMISDVPIGAFLSGGVDSSAIVALMAQNSRQAIKTFTIGFEEKNYDERRYAKNIVDLYKTDHTELVVRPQSIESLPDLVAHYEEPFADSSSVITTIIGNLARNKVTVILNGDGSDESWGGYLRHSKLQRDVWLSNHSWLFAAGRPLAKFLSRQNEDIRQKYASYNQYFNPSENARKLWFAKCDEAGAYDIRDALMYADLGYYFSDSQLTKTDLGSMRSGLETRSPFADYKFMELAAKIPYDLKVHGGETKYILKKALEKIVPYENLYRKKMGFSVPLSKWFDGKLRDYTLSRLNKKNFVLGEFVKKDEVKRMLKEHTEKNDYGPKLWSLLTLQLWWERYFT